MLECNVARVLSLILSPLYQPSPCLITKSEQFSCPVQCCSAAVISCLQHLTTSQLGQTSPTTTQKYCGLIRDLLLVTAPQLAQPFCHAQQSAAFCAVHAYVRQIVSKYIYISTYHFIHQTFILQHFILQTLIHMWLQYKLLTSPLLSTQNNFAILMLSKGPTNKKDVAVPRCARCTGKGPILEVE